MRCLVDDNSKMNIFYALKGGSRQIQNYYKSNNIDPYCRNYKKIYKNWLICRNPYDRIVSVFLQRYINGQSTHLFKPKNFSNFIDCLYKQYEKYIEKIFEYKHLLNFNQTLEVYHTLPLSSFMPKVKFVVSKLENISFLNLKTETETNRYSTFGYQKYKTECLAKIDYKDLIKLKNNIIKTKKRPYYSCFYNKDILKKIDLIYKTDFDLLNKYKINYDKPI